MRRSRTTRPSRSRRTSQARQTHPTNRRPPQEEALARAKKTDRAEARRRHRIALAAQDGDVSLAESVSEDAAGAGAAPRRQAAPGGHPARPGILTAFRTAMQPADIREDLRYLPTLALHTRAIWLPSLLVVAAAVIAVVGDPVHNSVALLVVQFALVPPAMIPAFLAGILTTRASWLAGGITGMVASVAFVLAVSLIPVPEPGGSVRPPTSSEQSAYIASALANLPMGFLIGALAGFYRRMLRSTGPARPGAQRRRPAGSRARGR